MTPNVWLLLLMFVLGAALTWVAMVRTVTRDVDLVRPLDEPGTGATAATTLTYHGGRLPPRRAATDEDPFESDGD